MPMAIILPLVTHLVDPGVVPPVGGVVVAEVAELPVAGLVVQVAQGVLVPLHRDVRGPHHLGHLLTAASHLTSSSPRPQRVTTWGQFLSRGAGVQQHRTPVL